MNNKGIHELNQAINPPGQKPIFSRYLDTVGDGSGTKVFIGDQSPAVAKIVPAAGEIMRITRLIVYAEDTAFLPAVYGANITLTNGIAIKVMRDTSVLIDLTDGVPIKNNGAWGRLCYDVVDNAWGNSSANESLHVRWTFAKAGQDIRLVGDESDSLQVQLNDDFSGLIDHTFIVQGYYE